ncbi:transposase [Pseudomonas fragi]|uniref:transposase n=1 Tax=Pseudomonas fragi TaxID=296 RepID=UPI0021BFEE61|nr:transposase [Pseudomonas fragi]UXL37068.1 transposase [Pseudomonas fragi]
MPQKRRSDSYFKSFKAQVIAECAQPDSSIASVALAHNLVHKWIRVHEHKNQALQSVFIPVKVSHSTLPQALAATIRNEVPIREVWSL